MTTENIEVTKRYKDAFNRRDLDTVFECTDPDVEWVPITAALEGTSYRGHAGIRQWIEDLERDWEVFEVRPEEYIDLGDDRVLVLGRWQARGRSSGVELDSQQASWILNFREARITRLQTFTNRAKALQEAGMEK